MMGFFYQLLALGLTAATTTIAASVPKRQIPAASEGVHNITLGPNGATIRFKEPGICETTPGVKSYAGYVDLSPTSHTFFWFFEARNNPETAPLTLWLNGGPGSDSNIGLFQELGPCNVTANLTTMLNPHAFNEVSNMLFISQPLGTGFSYAEEEVGSINPITDDFQNATVAPGVTGRFPVIDASKVDTTDLAAMATWEVLQAFLELLPQLDSNVPSKVFSLWTESYGGHYGPAFYHYFQEQNALIANGTNQGVPLVFDTLGVINGIIDEMAQAPMYPEFAVNNTYGIKAYNDTVYEYAKFAWAMPFGCKEQIEFCRETNHTTPVEKAICAEAGNMCRDNVEGPYENIANRGVYDIRHPNDDPTPPSYFEDYLNLAEVQAAIGVDLNYTSSNTDTYYSFQQSGDFVYGNFRKDLEAIIASGVRVQMIYGDADYICNWFGGQAVSLELEYEHSAEFRASGYVPFVVDGVEYGETRGYGNFSFTRVYESGHEVPYYQPIAALALFERALNHVDVATGLTPVTNTTSTNGTASATHTEPAITLAPTATDA